MWNTVICDQKADIVSETLQVFHAFAALNSIPT